MLIILFRVLIVYITILLFMRLMGKRQLGEMQPFELVITLIIADIVTLPMTQTSMPMLYSLIPLTALVILQYIVSVISRKSIRMRKIINGKPVVIVSPKGIEYDALKELNMNFDDLMQGLRSCGYYKVEDVQYAIVETNGTISVIPKSENAPVCNQDMNIKLPPVSLPLNIVAVGKIITENFKLAQIDKQFLQKIFDKVGVKSEKDILILTLDTNGKVYVQPFKSEGQQIQTDYNGGQKW